MYELPDTTGEVSASDDQLANQNNAVELKEAEENGKRSFRTTELCSNETDPVACYNLRMYGTANIETPTSGDAGSGTTPASIAPVLTTTDTTIIGDAKINGPDDKAEPVNKNKTVTQTNSSDKKIDDNNKSMTVREIATLKSKSNTNTLNPEIPTTTPSQPTDQNNTVTSIDSVRENPKPFKQESEKKEDISRAKATTVPTEPDSKKIADNFKKDFEKFDTGETKPKSFVEKFISSPYLKMAGIVGVGIIAVEKFLKKDKNKDDDRSPSSDKNATAKSGGANGKTGIAKYAGTYTGKIAPKSNGRFGDGTWAYGDKVLMKKEPSIKGFGYALGGEFSLTIGEDGKLSGGLKIWGHDCPFEVGALPAGKNDLQFIIPGAQGYLKFDAQSGKVTGWVAEPGAGNAPMYKRGIISGRRN